MKNFLFIYHVSGNPGRNFISAGFPPAERKSIHFMRNDIIRRGLSGLLSGVMLIGLLPTAAFAAAPTDHNYQATEYKNQEPGVDENMEPGSDLNIYVSIDMSDGDEQIYSVHTCSDPQVSDPEISPGDTGLPGADYLFVRHLWCVCGSGDSATGR